MPNTETVRALVNAFNMHNYARNTVETNFTLQSRYGEDYIVVSFDKGMKDYQCSEYLYNIKRKIVGEFYGIEEGDTDEVVLNTAKLIFDVKSFPFNDYKGDWSIGKQGRIEFVAPIDNGVIFNLKSHLASSLKKDVLEDMPTCSIVTSSFNKEKYLCHSKFPNKKLRKEFERKFLSRMRERYENAPKNPLEGGDNSVYIRDVFDDARFIDSVTRYIAWLEGMHLEVNSSNNRRVKLLKDMIIRSLYQSTGIMLDGFICASPLGRKDASVLVPVILDDKGARLLTHEEALKLNYAFNGIILNNIDGKAQGEISINGDREKYGIDFSNPEISHSVITKIIESSVINAKHELSIDPELCFQALSPAQSPFNSPTHAGPSGIRTPPNKRKKDKDTDSGYDSNSPTKPKDSVAHSPRGVPVPRSLFEQPQAQRFPTRSQGEELEGSPRRGSEKRQVLHNPVNLAGPSKGFSPSTQLSSSGPSSWKGTNPVGANPWVQQTNRWSLQSSNLKEDYKKICEDFEEAYKKIVSDSSLSKKEQELFEALLYAFNLSNSILECSDTNFIVKNGKIASFIDDGVDVKKYLQEIIDKTKEEKYYYVNEKEAYDLNEFPFKFLSNCEKNQKTTVVANMSSGALLNLKKLFIHGYKKELKIRDIDIKNVKKTVKLRRCELIGSDVKKIEEEKGNHVTSDGLVKACYPDESALEYIPIKEYETGYRLDRTYSAKEVESFRKEQWPAKGTRNTTTTFKKIEESKKDDSSSGYSSGFVTNAENVSSKAEATTSGYEFMDCENTRGGSPKRKSLSPEDGVSPRKSSKRDPLPLSRLESLSLSSSSHQIGKC